MIGNYGVIYKKTKHRLLSYFGSFILNLLFIFSTKDSFMPRNKNNKNQTPNQNKQYYHPRQQQQNMGKNYSSRSPGRDAAYIQKQQSEQQEHLAKLLDKQHQEVENMADKLRGPIAACIVPQLLSTVARNREAARDHEINLMNEAVKNSGPRAPSY